MTGEVIYDTGNPVPSADAYDRHDNTRVFDSLINSDETSVTGRTGKVLKSWAGLRADFAAFLVASGYEFIGDYDTDGPLLIERPNQVFTKDGEYWRSGPGLSLPYTTVNNWSSDAPKFVVVGDAVLRQGLADESDSSNGASKVGRTVQVFNTVAAMVAASSSIKAGQAVMTKGYTTAGDGGGATYAVQSSSSEPSIFTVSLGMGKVAVLQGRSVSPLQVGYILDAGQMDTVAKVNANWAIMKALINGCKSSSRAVSAPAPQVTMREVCANWLARRAFPIGAYSDSTTDGATTTGHVSSTGSTSPFSVAINGTTVGSPNGSPNAYPAKVEEQLKLIIGSDKPVTFYNGGFDSQSYANGFGLLQWYNTWFRPGGSNMNWTDVKAIILGFGTSDSINMNDPGAVLDAYGIDIECTIIDCLMRGVAPILQGPVLTTQKASSSVNYRRGDESITLIETMQRRLCQRYGLEHLSYREEVENLLTGYSGVAYNDCMSTDMVHPNDMGHRIHAGYLISKLFPNLARIKPGKNVEHLFAGHNAYITTVTDNISPASQGGVILKTMGVKADESYFYSWRGVDGNSKAAGSLLVRLPIYVDRPTNLYINDGAGVMPSARVMSLRSGMLNAVDSLTLSNDAVAMPVRTYNKRRLLARLPYGLSIINLNAGSAAGDYQFVSMYLADAERDPMDIPPVNPSGTSASYGYKSVRGLDMPVLALGRPGKSRVEPWSYYNQIDARAMVIRFELMAAPLGTVTMRSHYQDYTNWRSCCNQIQIAGDVVTTQVINDGTPSTVDTQTIAGLGALLVEGARIQVRYTTRFATSQGMLVELLVNGVVKYTYSATSPGGLFPDGFGFETTNLLRTGEVISSFQGLFLLGDIRYYL